MEIQFRKFDAITVFPLIGSKRESEREGVRNAEILKEFLGTKSIGNFILPEIIYRRRNRVEVVVLGIIVRRKGP